MKPFRSFPVRLVGAMIGVGLLSPAVAPAADEPPIRFARDILPILSDNCFHCHGPDEKHREADLRLDTQDGALKTVSPVIMPGKSGESELVKRITSTDPDEMMPPAKSNRKLSEQQRQLLRRWIDEGAPWGKHWAYEAPVRPEPPTVKKANWAKNSIDHFILARLEQEKLAPSPEASKTILIRRVSLDLTGLPPTPAEVEAFLADTSPQAYEKVVDRLLESPRYGERMAWDWLDAARYADSNGYQGDVDRTMYPWRDWVIGQMNANLPYDRFTVEQLGGDLLPSATIENKLATGFARNHMINGEGGRISEENRIDYIMDQTETMATIWMGLTMTCCRCHDHKFDPFKQTEYYSLFAFFNQTPVDGGGRSGQTKPVVDFATPDQAKRRTELQVAFDDLTKQVRDQEKSLRDASFAETEKGPVSNLPALIESSLRKGPGDRTPENREELLKFFKEKEPGYIKLLGDLDKAQKARDAFNKTIPQVMVLEDMPKPRDTFLLDRGAYNKPLQKVLAGVPESLPPLKKDARLNRLTLAEWLVAPEHPLTARVTVNRFWQTFFGMGLVKTVEDFGVQGERPSHPELLDWLATEFIAAKWDVKKLHKLILMSATYRQSSKATPALLEKDPENRLLARGARYRLPSWMIRDQALAASGLLVEKIGGPPVKPYQPEGIWEEATFGKIGYKQDQGPDLYRRSLYTFWRRIVGPTMFFDNAARQVCTVKAVRTNTPLHALSTLNDIQYVEAARALAERAMKHVGDPMGRIDAAFQWAAGRRPNDREREILLASLARLRKTYGENPEAAKQLLSVGQSKRDESLDAGEHAAYAGLCTLILNLDEVLTKQ